MDKTMNEIEQWASTVTRYTKSETAKAPKKIRDSVREFLTLKAEGKVDISVARFHKDFLVGKLKYPLGVSALRSYMLKYEPDLYERAMKNGK
jgi:hypothetical protein